MKAIGYRHHAIFFAAIKLYSYFFNFYPYIPAGKFYPYTLFFLFDSFVLIAYFYLALFLSARVLQRRAVFIPFQLGLILISTFIISLSKFYFFQFQNEPISYIQVYFLKLFEVTFITFSAIGFLFLGKWLESIQQQVELTEALTEAELTFLRSQMSPHFLFNTLNSIYSLALNKSPESHNAIREVRTIYAHLNQHKGSILLKDEVLYIENFIRIQRRRVGDWVGVETSFELDQDYPIEPLLLSTFVENAFKHGVSMKENSFVIISLKVKEGKLEYCVRNSNHAKKLRDRTSGIGLKNLSRRLELLYPGRYELAQAEHNGQYVATLSLQLV